MKQNAAAPLVPEKFSRAPFPYFGGKRDVAARVWARLGEPKQYIEPFAGSLAMLLAAPTPAKLEVIGDQNFYVANFWRCIKFQPDATAHWQDYPVSHVDLAARHCWLTEPARTAALQAKLADPEWPGDAQMAGWWVWGQCAWIGSGWCEKPVGPKASHGRIPHLSSAGQGVQVHTIEPGRGAQAWFAHLAERLQRVRVIHGDWTRCLNHHYGGANTAIFFDPPYRAYERLYAVGSNEPVAVAVAKWCAEHENEARIALCGHIGDYRLKGWTTMKWSRTRNTYGSTKTKDAECIWFSPGCKRPAK